MDPLDFLAVAISLRDSNQESERRTSVGRSYFALFNHLRAKLSNIRSIPRTAEAHSAVVHYLTKANNQHLWRVGQSLRDLRTSRNVADYELKKAVGINQSRTAVKRAQSAVDRIDKVSDQALRSAVNAVPKFSA